MILIITQGVEAFKKYSIQIQICNKNVILWTQMSVLKQFSC